MELNIAEIINRIDKVLAVKKLSKKELAAKCDFTYQSFFDWKLRGTIPSAKIIYAISKELNVSIDYLLCGESFIPDDIAVIISILMELNQEQREPIVDMLKSYKDYWRYKKND